MNEYRVFVFDRNTSSNVSKTFIKNIYTTNTNIWFSQLWLQNTATSSLHRGETPPPRHQWVSWIWYKSIWCRVFSNPGALGNAEYPFIAIAPWMSLTRIWSTWLDPIFWSNRTVWCLNRVLMLIWFNLDRSVFTFNDV